jgi:Cyclophilin type peptidyl-prolyl cis-trans isomerase/CLD
MAAIVLRTFSAPGTSLSMKHGVRTATLSHTVCCQRRLLSMSSKDANKTPPSSSSSSNFMWHAATAAAFGLSFIGARYAIKNMNLEVGESDGDSEDVLNAEPQAQVTSKVYFDISINQQPAGRIIMGLYGGVVPKTAKNFEALCKGTEKKGNIELTYSKTTFHRIIPGFMVGEVCCPNSRVVIGMFFVLWCLRFVTFFASTSSRAVTLPIMMELGGYPSMETNLRMKTFNSSTPDPFSCPWPMQVPIPMEVSSLSPSNERRGWMVVM